MFTERHSKIDKYVDQCLLGTEMCFYIGVGRGGGGGARGGQAPPIILEGGANIPFGPPNNPPTFSFNFYVK